MVRNGFVNRNFMHSQWEGAACTQSALIFSLLSFKWRGWGGGFFSFFLCSQHVLNMFLSSSQ
jgi:hypothetical protein